MGQPGPFMNSPTPPRGASYAAPPDSEQQEPLSKKAYLGYDGTNILARKTRCLRTRT